MLEVAMTQRAALRLAMTTGCGLQAQVQVLIRLWPSSLLAHHTTTLTASVCTVHDCAGLSAEVSAVS